LDTRYDDEVAKIVRQLARIAIERRLRRELDSIAPELPKEARDMIYDAVFRPVMVESIKAVRRCVKNSNKRSSI